MNPLVWVLLALVVLVAAYFVFRKKEPELPEAEEPKKIGGTSPRPQEPTKRPEAAPKTAEKAAAKPAAKPSEDKAAKERTDAARAAQEAKTTKEPAVAPKPKAEPATEPKTEPAPKPRAEPEVTAPRTSTPPASRRPKDVAGLRRGLAKARESEGFFGRLRSLFSGKKEIDPQIVEQMEEILLTSDVGVKTTSALVSTIRDELSRGELKDEAKVWDALRTKAEEILDLGGGGIALGAKPTVVMVVGVNGVGKTTTIGKLATRLGQQGKKVVLAAGDTFRAAAVHQLEVWGKRAGCEVVTGPENGSSAAVIFDAIQKAKDTGADIVLADTAGRLHTKTNLMEELKKIYKTMGKAFEGAPHETLLVLDATNGQNAIQQVALFKEALPLSGIVLTKLDGTAKGGVILGICSEHQVPVRYVGVGERPEDLRDFQADEFVEALLGGGNEAAERAA